MVTILIVLSLIYGYLNGFHDSSNIVATIISSHAMSPRMALALVAVAESAGPFIFGVAVANSIGEGIVAPGSINTSVVLATLISAIVWNLATWFFGIPSSSSHALVGGLVGAVMADTGFQTVQLAGLTKVLVALFISPLLGLIAGYLVTKLTYFLARGATPRINSFFRNAQILTGVTLALSHGANDAQKTMGIMTLGLVVTGVLPQFVVPTWVIALSAAAIALGTASGGWRLIRTLGARFYKIRPVNGFCSQIASTAVILGAALLGGPVSTTQVVSSAILGAGSAERVNKVRWGVAGQIVIAWVLTIPATALLSVLVFTLIHQLLGSV
ncbi:MAG TPA: anion permease [Anaerolineaceae bacterium]|jgi:PiT family inorganic phosphate transporter